MQGEQTDPEIEHCEHVVVEVLNALEIPSDIVNADQRAAVTMLIGRERAIARSSSDHNLRGGRPEHLTLAAAERHVDWVREAAPGNLTVVGRLLVVAVDAVRELRNENTALRAAREGVAEAVALSAVEAGAVELARKLIAIQFDQWGRPTVKLPDCWRCEEDELCCPVPQSPLRRWVCLRCNWEFIHVPLLPQVQVQDA